MKLKQGQTAPNFEVLDIQGNKINLNKLSNHKILLTFFRYAECALCNLRISEIKNESQRLKMLDIKLIAVFQSSKDSLIKNVQNEHAFDFTIIADPNRELYDLYQVKPSWIKLIRTTTWKGVNSIIKASKKGYKPGGKVEGKFHQIPADFLINQDKKIEIAYYGSSVIDHISIEKLLKSTTNTI
ncbi:peroxiredoxin-like family protein [Kordia sp.]|uniref:peroxiredoxin-like family protein n=1 Tax=Kordia sp. TaxID=1965332 RepID=UPI003B59F322